MEEIIAFRNTFVMSLFTLGQFLVFRSIKLIQVLLDQARILDKSLMLVFRKGHIVSSCNLVCQHGAVSRFKSTYFFKSDQATRLDNEYHRSPQILHRD